MQEELIQKESVKKEEQEPNQSLQEHDVAGFVGEVKNMIEKIGEVQKEFQSKELNGGAFDNLSEQDDKLKVGLLVCPSVCACSVLMEKNVNHKLIMNRYTQSGKKSLELLCLFKKKNK